MKSPPPPNGNGLPRTLGPVSDLERHLPSEWWRTLFNAYYLKTDGDVVENREATRLEIDRLLQSAEVSADTAVLDLCCGQGRHSLELARRGFAKVAGVDRSRYLIRLARRRARQEGLSVEFREGDARRFRFKDRRFGLTTLLGNSFGYFERPDDDEKVLRNAAAHMEEDGVLAMDVVDGAWMREHYEPRSWEWIDKEHFVCRERSLAKDSQRLVAREVIVHAEKGVLVDQFYAERLYDGEQIIALLKRIGFRQPRLHDRFGSESTRGQDLGMLQHRMLITAHAPIQTAGKVTARARIPYPEVTVLLGDPRLPDRIKLEGRFGPEDIQTVEKLKEALSTLKDYRFSFVDDHAALIAELTANPPAFAFNLCDEGYRNEALLELHVPAALEMSGVPYSGAAPACLAICYDKGLVRAMADALDIPTPMESHLGPDDAAATIPATFPALIKPNQGDSSIGIPKEAVVRTQEELMARVEALRKLLGPVSILVQEYLEGPEYSIGVIGNPGLGWRVLPPLEVDYSGLPADLPPILGYESKWDPTSPYWTRIAYRPARLSGDRHRALVDHSLRLFERLGCRDYARFDYRADSAGKIKLLEVNPNPGWCWDGKFNLMAGFEGKDYAGLLQWILEAAQERCLRP